MSHLERAVMKITFMLVASLLAVNCGSTVEFKGKSRKKEREITQVEARTAARTCGTLEIDDGFYRIQVKDGIVVRWEVTP